MLSLVLCCDGCGWLLGLLVVGDVVVDERSLVCIHDREVG